MALLALFSAVLTAQQCTGNLGENIFTEGDFGSGPANILTPDPGIAPGFLYQPNPPPNDGFYTITNDMRSWAFAFPAWETFADNSNDPNGYMMVVNAAFDPGKFYEQQVDFSIDDVSQFTTGLIPETGTWNTYGFTFTTPAGSTTTAICWPTGR